MKKILVIQTAFLGDVILATALLENLHLEFPGAELTILVREGNEGLFAGHPFLHEVLIWKKKDNKLRNLVSLIRRIRKNKYDLVINLQRFFATGLITAFSGAALRAGFNKNPWSFTFTHVARHIIGDGRHETDRNLLLTSGICGVQTNKPRVYPPEKTFENTKHLRIKPYVVMAPASVWFTKQLPEPKWHELIANIPNEIKVYLVGSLNDHDLCQRITEKSGRNKIQNLAGKLNLLETASLMREAEMNYVNDSGPLHLASAVNAPVTAFFCSTLPAFGFGPLSDNATIIETSENLSCRPCGLHGKKACPLGHFMCATTIRVPVFNQATIGL